MAVADALALLAVLCTEQDASAARVLAAALSGLRLLVAEAVDDDGSGGCKDSDSGDSDDSEQQQQQQQQGQQGQQRQHEGQEPGAAHIAARPQTRQQLLRVLVRSFESPGTKELCPYACAAMFAASLVLLAEQVGGERRHEGSLSARAAAVKAMTCRWCMACAFEQSQGVNAEHCSLEPISFLVLQLLGTVQSCKSITAPCVR